MHGDLCGPVTPVTPGGRCYFLLLVDDLSRFMWVMILGSKGEAADAIRRAQAAAEAESGRMLRVLRTDATTPRRTARNKTASSSSATRRLWGWPGPSSSRGGCRLSSGERRW